MTCGLCRKSRKDKLRDENDCPGIETVDECPTGEVGQLGPELAGFKFLLDRFLPLAFSGMGGVQPDAFRIVFDTWGVPAGQRPVLVDFLLVVVKAMRDAEKNKQDRDQGGSVEERQKQIMAMLPRKEKERP